MDKIILCDKCKEEIDVAKCIAEKVIDHDKDGKEVKERYFECKKCGAHYTIIIEDEKTRKLIAKRNDLMAAAKRAAKAKNDVLLKRHIATREKVKEELLKHGAELKAKYC